MIPDNIALDPIGDIIRITKLARKFLDFSDFDIFAPLWKPKNLATIVRNRRNAAYWNTQSGGKKSRKKIKNKRKSRGFRKTRNK